MSSNSAWTEAKTLVNGSFSLSNFLALFIVYQLINSMTIGYVPNMILLVTCVVAYGVAKAFPMVRKLIESKCK